MGTADEGPRRHTWNRLGRLAALAVALAGGGSVAWGQAALPCRVSEGPGYLDARDPGKTSVVVFIHGVLSSAVGAWSSDEDTSWPCLLRREPAFNNSNIYLYGYETSLRDENPSIEKVARQMLVDMNHDAVLSHAHVTIVAHSMGGLVTSRMLLAMQGSAELRPKLPRIKLVSFFGTPATGADIANVASQISYNVQFAEMKREEGQQALIDEWARVAWPFKWYCLAEGKNTGWRWLWGTMIVPKDSASALCRTRPASSTETLERFDHISMVKPVSLQDSPHRYLRRYFMSCVADALPRSYPIGESATPDGRLLLQMLDELRARMADTTSVGRAGLVAQVQSALYVSSSDRFLMPANPAQPSLLAGTFDRLSSRPFALELVKLFQSGESELEASWVGRFSQLRQYFPDGQLTELMQAWLSSGFMQEDDLVVTLQPRPNGEQVVLLATIQEVGGARKGRIRGLVVLPAQPRLCV